MAIIAAAAVVVVVVASLSGCGVHAQQDDTTLEDFCMDAARPLFSNIASTGCCPTSDPSCDGGPPTACSLACAQAWWPVMSTCTFNDAMIGAFTALCAVTCAGGQCGPPLTPENTEMSTPSLPSADDMYSAQCNIPEVRCSSFRDRASCSAEAATASLHWDVGAQTGFWGDDRNVVDESRYRFKSDIKADLTTNYQDGLNRNYIGSLTCAWCECDGAGEEGTGTVTITVPVDASIATWTSIDSTINSAEELQEWLSSSFAGLSNDHLCITPDPACYAAQCAQADRPWPLVESCQSCDNGDVCLEAGQDFPMYLALDRDNADETIFSFMRWRHPDVQVNAWRKMNWPPPTTARTGRVLFVSGTLDVDGALGTGEYYYYYESNIPHESAYAMFEVSSDLGTERDVEQTCHCTGDAAGGFSPSCNDFRTTICDSTTSSYSPSFIGGCGLRESRGDHFFDPSDDTAPADIAGLVFPGSNPNGDGTNGDGTYCQIRAPGCHDFYANSLAAQCDQFLELCEAGYSGYANGFDSCADRWAWLCTDDVVPHYPDAPLGYSKYPITIGAAGGPQCSFFGEEDAGNSPMEILMNPQRLLGPIGPQWLGENGGCGAYYDAATQCIASCMDQAALDSFGLPSLDFCPGSYTLHNTGPMSGGAGWSCSWEDAPNVPAAGSAVPTVSLVWSCIDQRTSERPCEDDPAATLADNGFTCASFLALAGSDCTVQISTFANGLPGLLADQCPVSCGMCHGDGGGGH